MYNAIIFDFDGTICDTGEGVKKSAKFALDAFEIESEEWQQLDHFIGPPLLITFQERYHQSAAQADALVKKFRQRYTKIGVFESKLYDGIKETLKNLKAHSIKIGIASSKPTDYIQLLLNKFGIADLFDSVCGVSFKADCESKQSIIARCLKELGCAPHQAVMVGDRFYDADGAKANLMDCIGVMWGYGSREEFLGHGAKFIIDKPEDIEAVALGMFEQTDRVNTVFDGRIITVHKDDVSLCNGSQCTRECVDHPGGVGIIALTDDNKVLLVRQFRYPYKEIVYEIPAGKLEKGEDPFEASKREFSEECGASAGEFISLGEIYPTPGYTNEIIRLYAAFDLSFEKQHLDDDEFLEVCAMDLDVLISKIMSGEIKDAKTITAAFKLKEILKNKNRE